MDSIRC